MILAPPLQPVIGGGGLGKIGGIMNKIGGPPDINLDDLSDDDDSDEDDDEEEKE